MKPLLSFFFSTLLTPSTIAFTLTTYDLALQGLYPTQSFHTTSLAPPDLKIDRWDSRCDSGYTFLTPRGPLVKGHARGPFILDNQGELVWMGSEKWTEAMDFHVQSFKGEEFLTFWTKTKRDTKKGVMKTRKSFVMLNSAYEVAYEITPVGKHLKADSHEFRLTPQGTALIALYPKRQTDCTELHLGKKCWIRDGWFQEIDIQTGKLLFEWKASEHVGWKDVYSKPCRKDGYGKSKKDAFDWFHLNAIDKTEEGDYLVSARYLHAILCISGKTGEILWQLGGKQNSFRSEDGALDFKWQHHVTWLGNNTLSLFDNHANSVLHKPSSHSKGMIIRLDLEGMTARLEGEYVHPDEILNVSQGSVQVLPESGNVLVGFGNSPTWVEYTKQGEVLCSAHFAPKVEFEVVDFGFVKSYRIFKGPWVGKPKSLPDVKVKAGKVWVSWNGATEVKGWRLEMGREREGEFEVVQELEKKGFESSFLLEAVGSKMKTNKWLKVTALDSEGEVMASSEIIKRPAKALALRWLLLLPLTLLLICAVLIVLRKASGGGFRPFDSLFSGLGRVRLEEDCDENAVRRKRFGSWPFARLFVRPRRSAVPDEGMPLLEEPYEDEV